MRLNHNMNALSTYKAYTKNIKENAEAMGRVSSGLKINSAKDNPNKIAQSEQMRIQIKSLIASQRNLQDASSMLQTADGGLQEASNTLNRMRELAVSASDGTKSDNDRAIIQTEIKSLKDNLGYLANNTEFNGFKMIGNPQVKNNNYPIYANTAIGIMVGEQARIPLFNVSPGSLKDKDNNILENIDLSSTSGASRAIKTIDDSIDIVSSIRAQYGALMNRFENTVVNQEAIGIKLESAESSLRDADIAVEMLEVSRTQLLNNTSLALIAQSNNIPLDALRTLERVR